MRTALILLLLLTSTIFAAPLRDKAFMEEIISNVCANVSLAEEKLKETKTFEEKYDLARSLYENWADEKFQKQFGKEALEKFPLILGSIERIWSEEHAQRKSGPLSMSELIESIGKLEELKKRIEDPDDLLVDIDNYKRLLLVPSYTRQIYDWVEDLYFTPQYSKSKTCFEFFLLEENTDDFTRGAATFFLGRYYKTNCVDQDHYRLALPLFLSVQRYATYPTYICYAYNWAAEIYAHFGQYKQALALDMKDIPCEDLASMRAARHRDAYYCASAVGNKTNSIKHLHEWIRYEKDKNLEQCAWALKQLYSDELWNYCATNFLTMKDYSDAVEAALTDEGEVFEEELLFEALMHPWPTMDELPKSTAINLILSNNVFQVEKK